MLLNLGLIILDRLSKWYIQQHPNLYSGKLIQLKLFKNPKFYFISLNSTLCYLIAGAVLLLFLFLCLNYAQQKKDFLSMTGISLIIFGGLSNLADRIIFGYVIDWIKIFILPFSVFNIADIMIISGAIILAIKVIKK